MIFHHTAGQTIEQHPHPAWEIIVPYAGHIVWKSAQGPARQSSGVIFPPQMAHVATTISGSMVVFINPWFGGLGPGHGRAIPLDPSTVEHVRVLWGDGERNPDDCAQETVALLRRHDFLPRAISIDPRVEAALRDLPIADCIQHVAAAVGLSPSRLRALIHDQTGTPPAGLRMWQRLRAAIGSLPVKPLAAAAIDAGFADQAHLTRTATRLVGHTPGDLARGLSGVTAPRNSDRSAARAAAG